MASYGQFCPVAKSVEILGDTWSLLIIREMLLGSSRFGSLQKGLPKISPTVLNTRLKGLCADGVIVKKPLNGQRGHEYRLTAAGRELAPLVENLANWGMRWARDAMSAHEMDVSFLMFDIRRGIDTTQMPDGEHVLCFQFPDLDEFARWWVICEGADVDLCYDDPGKDVDLFITSTSHVLINAWMGDQPLLSAIDSGTLQLIGDAHLRNSFRRWFALSAAAGVPRPAPNERFAGF